MMTQRFKVGFYAFAKMVLWLFFRLGFGFEVVGQEHVPRRGGFILASNHVSFLDPPVVGVACPRRVTFMARADLFSRPFLGGLLWALGVMPLRRAEADLAAIRMAVATLEQGGGVAIFPEGTRQLSGRLGVAKRGVGILACAAKAPIVPVLVDGTFQALPPTKPLRFHRAKIRVAFGPAIAYTTNSSASHLQHEALAARVTQGWQELASQHQQKGRDLT